jgi:hypothetical protein
MVQYPTTDEGLTAHEPEDDSPDSSRRFAESLLHTMWAR